MIRPMTKALLGYSLRKYSLRNGGWLEKALGFEFRAEQAQMARWICEESGNRGESILLFEAGTGVGQEPRLPDPLDSFIAQLSQEDLSSWLPIPLICRSNYSVKDVLCCSRFVLIVSPGLETIADF